MLFQSQEDSINWIGKNANFRSNRLIVKSLHRLRPDLPQNVSNPNSKGEIKKFHSNNWTGEKSGYSGGLDQAIP